METTNGVQTKAQGEAIANHEEIIKSLVLHGDLSKMSDMQKVDYYNGICNKLQLNPLTQPFEIIKLNGKEKMYAKKDATDQLRKINGVSITDLIPQMVGDNYIVVAKGSDRTGRVDAATAVITLKGLAGENLANAMMKCETKAKRRLTLSLCGLGVLDETEVESLSTNMGEQQAQTQTPPTAQSTATPNAPAEDQFSTQAQVDEVVRLLDDPNMPEFVYKSDKNPTGIKKVGMRASVLKAHTDRTLLKVNAQKYIEGLTQQLKEAVEFSQQNTEDAEGVDVTNEPQGAEAPADDSEPKPEY